MKYLRSLSILVILAVLFTVPGAAIDFNAEKPQLEVGTALLLELNSGEVLLEKNADKKMFPASMTKIMTCLVTLENSTLSETVTVSETALAGLGEFSSTAGLFAGELLTMENLLYCMMLSSANEACNIAAEHISGSIDAFVEKMNQRAQELGCINTHFANTHGLHDENHYTTARDLSIILQEAMKNNTFRLIVSTASYTMPATNLSPARNLTTTNLMMLPTAGNRFYDNRVTGVKTGFTTPAGRCLAATAQSGTISLLSIVGGCATRILPSGDLEFGSFTETQKMLQYGFSNFTYETVLTTLYPLTEIVVTDSNLGFVALAPKEEISALLPAGYLKSDIVISTSLTNPDGVPAPVAAGDELGMVTITYRGQLLAQTPLVAITAVDKAPIVGLFQSDGAPGMQQSLLLILAAAAVLAFLLLLVIVVQIIKNRRLRKRYRTARLNSRQRVGANKE